MADDIDEQVTAHIREILHLVHRVKGETLSKLNELVGQTSKFKLQSRTNTKRKILLHMRVEFKLLRRSGRLHPKEGTYENMQGRPAKRRKLAADERFADTLPLNGPSTELASDGSMSKTLNESPSEAFSEASIEAPSKAHSKKPSDSPNDSPSKSPMNSSATSKPTTSPLSILPKSDTHVSMEGGQIESASLEGILSQEEVFHILEEYFEESAVDSGPVNDTEGRERCSTSTVECIYQDRLLEPTVRSNTHPALNSPQHPICASIDPISSEALDTLDLDPAVVSATISESGFSIVSSEPRSLSTIPTSYPPSETQVVNDDTQSGVRHAPCFKRSTLDELAQWLEHVLMALEAVDKTNCRPNSSVLGVLDILTTSDFTLCVRIMTTIAENLVKCSHCITKPASDAVQQRSREIEPNKIAPHVRRLTSAYTSRIPNQKDFPDDIVGLNMRDIAKLEIQRILSEPQELTGEFREESDYETAIQHIEKNNADHASNQLRHL